MKNAKFELSLMTDVMDIREIPKMKRLGVECIFLTETRMPRDEKEILSLLDKLKFYGMKCAFYDDNFRYGKLRLDVFRPLSERYASHPAFYGNIMSDGCESSHIRNLNILNNIYITSIPEKNFCYSLKPYEAFDTLCDYKKYVRKFETDTVLPKCYINIDGKASIFSREKYLQMLEMIGKSSLGQIVKINDGLSQAETKFKLNAAVIFGASGAVIARRALALLDNPKGTFRFLKRMKNAIQRRSCVQVGTEAYRDYDILQTQGEAYLFACGRYLVILDKRKGDKKQDFLLEFKEKRKRTIYFLGHASRTASREIALNLKPGEAAMIAFR